MDIPIIPLVVVPPQVKCPKLVRRQPVNHRRFYDRTGMRHNEVTVTGFVGFTGAYSAWLCKCSCGRVFIARSNWFTLQNLGCGCRNHVHGMTGSIEYRAWSAMRMNHASIICEAWQDGFIQFYKDVGPKPTAKHQLSLVDPYGYYMPGNARWGTQREAKRNKGSARLVEYMGECLCLAEWAERVGITRERMRQRANKCLALGASLVEAVTTPAGARMPCVVGHVRGSAAAVNVI